MADENDRKTLDSSKDPTELSLAGQRLASSADAQDLQFLRAKLGDAAFLDRLDRKELYEGGRNDLRLSKVMEALAKNQAAHEQLVSLTSDKVFGAEFLRVDLLILALAKHTDPSKTVVDYWSGHFKADSAHMNIVAMALCENATTQAAALLEKGLRDETFIEADRVGWLRAYFIEHRNAPALLAMAQRVIKGEGGQAREAIRMAMVDVVFDFRPTEWYTPHSTPKVPARALAKEEARKTLRATGEWAKGNLTLTPVRKLAVEKTLAELDALDRKDKQGPP